MSLKSLQTRRTFLQKSSTATIVATVPPRAFFPHTSWSAPEPHRITAAGFDTPITLRDPRIKALALHALDAARGAGASYADVRLTNTVSREYGPVFGTYWSNDTIRLGLSVRALVDGYWGWAATPYLAETEAPRIGRQAVLLAKAGAASGQPRRVEWNTIPVAKNGDWVSPITIDPIDVALEEVMDWLNGYKVYMNALLDTKGRHTEVTPSVGLERQERLFASTEGSLLTQTVHQIDPRLDFEFRETNSDLGFTTAQAGWEYIYTAPIHDLARREMDRIDAEFALHLPRKPIEVGRFDVIFTAPVMATLLGATMGAATELDRALGYEANAGGTSYLGPDPLALLGTSIASPLLTVTADRSTPKALATVQWDDEGVVPEVFPLIQQGVLTDYQTTREQAAWIAPWYAKQGRPVRSHGCAASEDALTLTMQHTPNLTLHPGAHDQGVEELIASLDHGLLIENLSVSMDFQHASGVGYNATVTEVRHGRRVARILGANFLFRTSDLWKNLQALGGPNSLRWFGVGESVKGEPGQGTRYSIAAVPALITQLAMVNPMKSV